MLELVGMISTVIAVIGVVLNNYKVRFCFWLWLISNSLSAGIHLYLGCYSLFVRDITFAALTIHGLWKWGQKNDRPYQG